MAPRPLCQAYFFKSCFFFDVEMAILGKSYNFGLKFFDSSRITVFPRKADFLSSKIRNAKLKKKRLGTNLTY